MHLCMLRECMLMGNAFGVSAHAHLSLDSKTYSSSTSAHLRVAVLKSGLLFAEHRFVLFWPIVPATSLDRNLPVAFCS